MRTKWFKERPEKSAAVVAALIGVVMLSIGWWKISGSNLVTEQIPYLASGAAGGLFALGVAATLWLSADLRDEYYKLDEIYGSAPGDHDENLSDGLTLAGEHDLVDPGPATADEGPLPNSGTGARARRRPITARS